MKSENRQLAGVRLDLQFALETEEEKDTISISQDYTYQLPDECLSLIFHFLPSSDRNRSSLVSRRWHKVERQSRHSLFLNHPRSDLLSHIPPLFTRYDAVSELLLRCDRRSFRYVDDDALILISRCCRNLARIHLRACRELTDVGISALAKTCKGLKKFSCGSCAFGVRGMNAVLNHCSSLEELSVKRLRGGGVETPVFGPGLAASSSLKKVRLEELVYVNGPCFGPLIVGSKNLKTVEVLNCLGDWDDVLVTVAANRVHKCLVEIHLERLARVTDQGIEAVAVMGCPNLVRIKVNQCTGVTSGLADRLSVVNLDEADDDDDGLGLDSSSDSDDGGLEEEDDVEFPPVGRRQVGGVAIGGGGAAFVEISSSSNGRQPFRSRFGVFGGRM